MALQPDSPDKLQCNFDILLEAADAKNQARRIERETAHLPSTMEEALPFYTAMISKHHIAMLAANLEETMRLREEAYKLALRLNNGQPGILARPDSPGNVLTQQTAAVPGTMPLWGQCGEFVIDVDGMTVRIALEGMFGIAGRACYWPGFSVHAVEFDKPFLNETGYRSFLGIHAASIPGVMPDGFTRQVIQSYVAKELKGNLVSIEDKYREQSGMS